MKLLSYFADRHTLPTTIVASLSGFLGLVLDHIDQVSKVVAFIGTCAGTATAILGALVMWRRNFRNRDQRRRFARDEPWEDHLP